MALEATEQRQATYDSQGRISGLETVKDEDGKVVYTFQPKQEDGAYDTVNGVYALSFGMGNLGIGGACLGLSIGGLTRG